MFFIISKLLPLFVLPLGGSIILLLLGYFYKKRWLTIIAAIFLYIFSLGIISDILLKIVEHPWERRKLSSVPYSDAIVVLSGSLHPAPGSNKVREWNDPDRFLAGITLYKAGKASKLIFTGGVNPLLPNFPPESEFYLEEAKSLGVPEKSIRLTPPVINTSQEAKAIRKLINRYDQKQEIILITSAFHINRAKKMFERQGFKVFPYPVDFKRAGSWAGGSWKDPLKWFPSAHALSSSSGSLREILGRLVYRTW